MQSTFSDMEVAISISGKFLIDQFTKPQTRQCKRVYRYINIIMITACKQFILIVTRLSHSSFEYFSLFISF